MRVLFWGTPDFALPTLRALLGEGFEVVAVVTRPDRPAGRGRRLRRPAVKEMAEDEGLEVFQPVAAGDEEFLAAVRLLEPEVGVVAAYGRFLPRAALDLPVHGTVNVHPSLLPELRGAAPVQWALIRGLERTGVSVIRLVEEMDAGPVLLQVEEPILPDESAAELAARLAEIGGEALVEALTLMEAGEIDEVEQDHDAATFAPPVSVDDARVDWSRAPETAAGWIRGTDDVPGAWTTRDGARLKVFRPALADGPAGVGGTVLALDDTADGRGMLVATGAGALWLAEVQPEGRRRMSAADWARGGGVVEGDRLGA
ncbi:MAG: methionyl-tRNA formyltransferase [Gemmatimonadota bacterium]